MTPDHIIRFTNLPCFRFIHRWDNFILVCMWHQIIRCTDLRYLRPSRGVKNKPSIEKMRNAQAAWSLGSNPPGGYTREGGEKGSCFFLNLANDENNSLSHRKQPSIYTQQYSYNLYNIKYYKTCNIKYYLPRLAKNNTLTIPVILLSVLHNNGAQLINASKHSRQIERVKRRQKSWMKWMHAYDKMHARRQTRVNTYDKKKSSQAKSYDVQN